MNPILAQFVNPVQIVFVCVLVLTGLVGLVFLAFFVSIFSLWIRAFLSGAAIPIVALIGMRFRRTPAHEIVKLRIMAVQAGVHVQTNQLESAYLQGADVERAVLGMIRAKEIGKDIVWEDLISKDAGDRLRELL